MAKWHRYIYIYIYIFIYIYNDKYRPFIESIPNTWMHTIQTFTTICAWPPMHNCRCGDRSHACNRNVIFNQDTPFENPKQDHTSCQLSHVYDSRNFICKHWVRIHQSKYHLTIFYFKLDNQWLKHLTVQYMLYIYIYIAADITYIAFGLSMSKMECRTTGRCSLISTWQMRLWP